jgi:hypothetical protein
VAGRVVAERRLVTGRRCPNSSFLPAPPGCFPHWDDDWRCVGGPTGLVEEFAGDPRLEVRRVDFSEDATPLGHLSRCFLAASQKALDCTVLH